MIYLYDYPFSPYAQKVKIALREKRIDFASLSAGGLGGGGSSDEFLAASPRAQVPAMIADGLAIFDSTIILEFLEDLSPTPPLLPRSPVEGARARMIEEVMDTQYEANNWAFAEVRVFQRATGRQAEALLDAARQELDGYHMWLERQLGDREWFNGESFGWADLAIAPHCNNSIRSGMGPPPGSKLLDWFDRASARPSVANTFQEASGPVLQAVAKAVGEVVESGALADGSFKRQYRDHRLEWMVRNSALELVADGLRRENIKFTSFAGGPMESGSR